jgi:hypothetical protein
MLGRLPIYSQSVERISMSKSIDTSIVWQTALSMEREAFDATTLRGHDSILFLKSLFLKEHGMTQNALETIERFTLCQDNSPLFNQWSFERSLLFYLNHQYESSLIAYKFFEENCKDSVYKMQSIYLKLLIFAQTKSNSETRTLFNQYCMNHEIPLIEANLFWNSNITNALSSKKAIWLSLLVPGLGQVYARDYIGGGQALLLKTLTALFIGGHLVAGYIFIPLITGIQLAMQFYRGDSRKAALTVLEYNQLQQQIFIKELTKFVIRTENKN